MGPVSPGRDPPVRTEMLLHESDRTRVARLFLEGGTAIRKEPVGPDAPRRLRHEMTILNRRGGMPGAAKLLEAPRNPDSFGLADVAGTSRAALPKPLKVLNWIGLAGGRARAVAGRH